MGIHPKIKRPIFSLLDFLGFSAAALVLTSRYPRVLLYHGVSPQIPEGIFNYRKKFISPESFRRQLIWLKGNMRILPLEQLIERWKLQKGLPEKSCAITFDDGYENLHRYAFPILRELAVPATVFATTEFVDQKIPLWVDMLEYAIGNAAKNSIAIKFNGQETVFSLRTKKERHSADSVIREYLKKCPQKEFIRVLEEIIKTTGKDLRVDLEKSPYGALKWEQIREMKKYHIGFGPHSLTHPIFSSIENSRAFREIFQSRKRMTEMINDPLDIFAYPNGQARDFNQNHESMLKDLGFRAALTTIPGVITPSTNPYQIPRFTLDGADDLALFRLTLSGAKNFLH